MLRHTLNLIFALLLLTRSVNADEGMLSFGAGYREDRFRFSVGSDFFPDIESEVRWKDIRIAEVTLAARYLNDYNYLFRVYANYGEIFDGKQTDEDSFEDFELLESKANADRGEVYDISGGIGYTFHFLCDRARISPIVGYSYHQQHFRMDCLRVTVDNITGDIGPVPGLDSSYRARWKGPWVGVEASLYMIRHLQLLGGAEYHWAHFRAKGHWNLRTDFVDDFHQHAHGRGLVYNLGIRQDVTHNLSFTLWGNYQAWRTRHGHDEVFLADIEIESDLHVVHWHTWSVLGTIDYSF